MKTGGCSGVLVLVIFVLVVLAFFIFALSPDLATAMVW